MTGGCARLRCASQALLDAVASFGGFYLGGLASQGEDFPFRCALLPPPPPWQRSPWGQGGQLPRAQEAGHLGWGGWQRGHGSGSGRGRRSSQSRPCTGPSWHDDGGAHAQMRTYVRLQHWRGDPGLLHGALLLRASPAGAGRHRRPALHHLQVCGIGTHDDGARLDATGSWAAVPLEVPGQMHTSALHTKAAVRGGGAARCGERAALGKPGAARVSRRPPARLDARGAAHTELQRLQRHAPGTVGVRARCRGRHGQRTERGPGRGRV